MIAIVDSVIFFVGTLMMIALFVALCLVLLFIIRDRFHCPNCNRWDWMKPTGQKVSQFEAVHRCGKCGWSRVFGVGW